MLIRSGEDAFELALSMSSLNMLIEIYEEV